MNRKRTKLISIIAILSIVGGIYASITSLPLYSLYTSIKQGGLTVTDKVSISQVQPNTPAEEAQLKNGDVIVSANGKAISKSEDFVNITNENQGQPINIIIDRKGITNTVQLTPRLNPPPGQGRVGVVLSNTGVERKPLYQVVPQVIIRAYSGYEERPVFFFTTTTYHDKYLLRLQSLISGVITIMVGFGLWKLKKWAHYGFLGLTIYGLVASIPYFINPENWSSNRVQALFMRQPDITDTIVSLIGIGIEILFAVYIYKQRKLFQ